MKFWQLIHTQRALLAFALVLGMAACGGDDDDDDTNGDVNTADELAPGNIPATVTAVEGPELSAQDAQAALDLSTLPSITSDDGMGQGAIAQGQAVVSQFSTVFQYAGSSAPSYVPQASQTITYTANGVTFKYIWSDEGDRYSFKSTISGTSTQSGVTFNDEEWYVAEVLKNRRSGRVEVDYSAFWDIYNQDTGYDYDGKYLGYYIIEESGKIAIVWDSNVSYTGQGQDVVSQYEGSVIVEADKSGQAEWEYNVGSAGYSQTGAGCSKWDTAGSVSDC